ncbi:MAG: TetR family transcriptional regulator [Propionibacteriaceae bacterium]|jgi:AcrR family transcriptional regulator|nr:TetR family transcriptional regulator [Propionibacteriaceae bacterium]
MRSVEPDTDAGQPDLTGRARIREAAVALFAAEGFGVTVRRIAQAAGVSPSLVIHHFGSKAALKEECDRQVGRIMLEVKTITVAQPPEQAQANLLDQLAQADAYGYLLSYVLRSVGAGGAVAAQFVDLMTEVAVELLQRGVAAGAMRRPRDLEAMARYLTYSGIGALVVWHALPHPEAEPGSPAAIAAVLADLTLPTLELCTDGLFTDSAALDAYLASRTAPETEPERTAAEERAQTEDTR